MPIRTETGTQLNLRMLDPKQGFAAMEEHVAASGLVPPESPTLAAVKTFAQERGLGYFMTPTGRKLLQRADNIIYDGISSYFGLSEGDTSPQDFYTRNMRKANEQVRKPIERYGGQDYALGLLNEVSVPATPGELVKLIAANSPQAQAENPQTADPRTLHELTRQVTLGLISGELESRAKNADQRLKDVLNWFNIDLFAPKPAQENMIYALHSNETNSVEWVSTSGDPIREEQRDNAHMKAHLQRMRYVDDEIGWVVVDGRLKEDGVNKAVRTAIVHEDQGKGDAIDPVNDIPDLMGIKFVVADNFSHDGPGVTTLINRVRSILKNRFGLDDTAFREKPFNDPAQRKSGKFRGTRLMVDFPDLEVPLEMMFHGQGDHLHNEFHIGEVTNSQTGRPNGAAHGFLDIDKGIDVLQRYTFPTTEQVNTGEVSFDLPVRAIVWEDLKRSNNAAYITKLQEAYRVDPATENAVFEYFAAQEPVLETV